jgi:16S rRNA (uracil1498-N3)-methyltransferase
MATIHRFFLSPDCIQDNVVFFPEDSSHQIRRVLRLQLGQVVKVLDNQGNLFEVTLTRISQADVVGEISAQDVSGGEPQTRVNLYLCLTQRGKFEWILQKCTELGAAAFKPLISSRSLVRDGISASNKAIRWKRILKEAAEQCGRGLIPDLLPVVSFESAMREYEGQDAVRIMLWVGENDLSIRKFLNDLRQKNTFQSLPDFDILVGPEGGFSNTELETAKSVGFIPVSLGDRILRMETAAITATALVLYEQGEMGN